MAKLPPYRLETLFNLRERALDKAQKDFALAKQRTQKAREKLESMKTELANMNKRRILLKEEYMQNMQNSVLNIGEIERQNNYIEALLAKEEDFRLKIEEQKTAVKNLEKEEESFRLLMIEKDKEFKALEKHKEKWALGAKKEIERKEEERMNEVAQSNYQARKRQQS